MKVNGNTIKPGNVIEHKGSLWVATKTSHVKPGKGGAFAQIELRNLKDGTKLNERFRSSESIEKVILEDVSSIITLCLRHRLRKDPLESIDSGDKVSKVFKAIFEIED